MPEKLSSFTPRTLHVLEFFFDNPSESFHEREIIRKTKVSKGSANKILRKLSAIGFLIREEKGRMVFYRLNIANIAVRQFKIFYNVWMLKDLIGKIKENSRKIILFGSVAEGIDVRESDIDMLIIAEEKNVIKEKISEFNKKSERKMSPIVVDFNEFIKLKKEDVPLYERIDRGIVLWESE